MTSLPQNRTIASPHPPPIATLSTSRLVSILLFAMVYEDTPPALKARGVTCDAVRDELQWRELAGIARVPR